MLEIEGHSGSYPDDYGGKQKNELCSWWHLRRYFN